MTIDVLQSKLAHLPGSPGVYLFKNEHRDIIYIGKAAVLADRVRSYFQKGAHRRRDDGDTIRARSPDS
jgi:excinuclease ABC subunit C